ncbi:hypothetical protein BaRGS_00038735, partial [Batillaria attramentaria]
RSERERLWEGRGPPPVRRASCQDVCSSYHNTGPAHISLPPRHPSSKLSQIMKYGVKHSKPARKTAAEKKNFEKLGGKLD